MFVSFFIIFSACVSHIDTTKLFADRFTVLQSIRAEQFIYHLIQTLQNHLTHKIKMYSLSEKMVPRGGTHSKNTPLHLQSTSEEHTDIKYIHILNGSY